MQRSRPAALSCCWGHFLRRLVRIKGKPDADKIQKMLSEDVSHFNIT